MLCKAIPYTSSINHSHHLDCLTSVQLSKGLKGGQSTISLVGMCLTGTISIVKPYTSINHLLIDIRQKTPPLTIYHIQQVRDFLSSYPDLPKQMEEPASFESLLLPAAQESISTSV